MLVFGKLVFDILHHQQRDLLYLAPLLQILLWPVFEHSLQWVDYHRVLASPSRPRLVHQIWWGYYWFLSQPMPYLSPIHFSWQQTGLFVSLGACCTCQIGWWVSCLCIGLCFRSCPQKPALVVWSSPQPRVCWFHYPPGRLFQQFAFRRTARHS